MDTKASWRGESGHLGVIVPGEGSKGEDCNEQLHGGSGGEVRSGHLGLA